MTFRSLMMRRNLSQLHVIVLTNFLVIGCARADSVTVNVIVHTEVGMPLQNAPLEAHTSAQTKFGFSNAAGQLSMQLDVNAATHEIDVWLYNGDRYADLPVDQKELASDKFKEYRDGYYF